ncbi:piggyBac transposable element-derived protein 4-like [Vespa velutina]|uniref:piggyBac transposable element-derived protein 4-like n=1 Tax=Vespa velutina TaxID=202808 RepID=UPI001FB32B71|nr:piggyBac transposable element-derived protein 4-like [Vespa velutina]
MIFWLHFMDGISAITQNLPVLNNNEENDPNETLIPIQGHIIFRQYLKLKKRHRYIDKIFKLCCGAGYTYSFQVYSEKVKNRDKTPETVSSEIVMSLCKDILGKGHNVYIDNLYISVDLAEKLIAKNIHLIGTPRKNRRGNSVELVSKKLKRGGLIARENKSRITILKWKDKRDVMMLSTKHSAEKTTVHKKFYSCEKQKMVVEYNLGKSSVDLSDQIIAYNLPLRKTLKWNRKLTIKLLLNTCINKVALYSTKCRNNDAEVSMSPRESLLRKPRHELKAMPGKTPTVRRFCKICYQKNSKKLGRIIAKNCSKKFVTNSKDCAGSYFLCLECFNTTQHVLYCIHFCSPLHQR